MGEIGTGFGSERAGFLLLVGVFLGAGVFGAIGNGLVLFNAYGTLLGADRFFALLWAAGTLGALAAGSFGLFQALSTGEMRQEYLFVFLILMSVSLQAPSWGAEFIPLSLSFHLQWSGYGFGPNFVGLASLWWYSRILRGELRKIAVAPKAVGLEGGADGA